MSRVITAEQLRKQIEKDIAYLRTVINEPVSIRYSEHVDVEVRPDNEDDRVLVGRRGWGFTTVNYTSEGLIVDVISENDLESLHTMSIPWDELAVSVDDEPEFDRALVVRKPAGKGLVEVVVRMTPYLTDRKGCIDYNDAGNKPLSTLQSEAGLLERLRSQMWEEGTVIARQYGSFGVLFERQFLTVETDPEAAEKGDVPDLLGRADLEEILASGLARLQDQFASVDFMVPDPALIEGQRTAVWAFVKDGLLTRDRLNELGEAIQSL